MRGPTIARLLIPLFPILLCPGRTGRAAEESAAPRLSQPGPEMLPDLRVVFRLNAPRATEVTLVGDFGLEQSERLSMKKDERGMWSHTSSPIRPGWWSYFFVVDGVPIPDPGNGSIKPGLATTQSALEIPGPEGDWLALKDVPHGEVRVIWYRSSALGTMRRMHVYVPPGYDSGSARYPVVYLLHGGGDTDDGWVRNGQVNFILDNLLAQGKARPMIVVMPFIFTVRRASAEWPTNSTRFGQDLVQDVIPYVERGFRVLPGSEHRAFGGLSMPSILTDVAFANLDRFDWVFFTSNGLTDERLAEYEKRLPGVLGRPDNVRRVKFWIGDGVNAMTFASARNLADRLKQRGYQTRFFATTGIHGWNCFSKCFHELAQVVFR